MTDYTTKIDVSNEELFTIRDCMRKLPLIIRSIEEGILEKAVLTRKDTQTGRQVMVAVITRLKDAP